MFLKFENFKIHKNLARHNIANNPFYCDIKIDLLERVFLLNREFKNILLLDNYDQNLYDKFNQQYNDACIFSENSDQIAKFKNDMFDLIIMPFSLHFINDLKNFFSNIKNLLSSKGAFLAKTITEKTLINLHSLFIALETKYSQPHQLRIIPPIKKDPIVKSLQNLGLCNIVLDFEKKTLLAPSPLDLIRQIKALGDGSTLISTSPSRMSKKIYSELASKSFTDVIFILNIFFTKTSKHKLTK